MSATKTDQDQHQKHPNEPQKPQHGGGSQHEHSVTDPQQSKTVNTEHHQKLDEGKQQRHDQGQQKHDQNAPKR